jgi:hypothetical protein
MKNLQWTITLLTGAIVGLGGLPTFAQSLKTNEITSVIQRGLLKDIPCLQQKQADLQTSAPGLK